MQTPSAEIELKKIVQSQIKIYLQYVCQCILLTRFKRSSAKRLHISFAELISFKRFHFIKVVMLAFTRSQLEWPIPLCNTLASFSSPLLKESLLSFIMENFIISSIKWISEMVHVNRKFCFKKHYYLLCPWVHFGAMGI